MYNEHSDYNASLLLLNFHCNRRHYIILRPVKTTDQDIAELYFSQQGIDDRPRHSFPTHYTREVVKTLQIPAKYNYNKTIEGSIFFGLILSLLHIVIESRKIQTF